MCRVSGTLLTLLLGVSLCYAAPALALGPGVTIATADMNGDGIPDLIELSTDDSTVNVVTADAKGNFALLPPQRFTDIAQMSSIAIADVNVDGIPDDHWQMAPFAGEKFSTDVMALTKFVGSSAPCEKRMKSISPSNLAPPLFCWPR